jgi:hypothetical protein
MKIVKMHEGSREAFDDFLEERLKELEIDNDAADKYFANMNLPVSVMPTPELSFFAKHKIKLWSLFLLCITSITTFTFLYNQNKQNNASVTDNKNTIQRESTTTAKATINPSALCKNNSENIETNKTANEFSGKEIPSEKKLADSDNDKVNNNKISNKQLQDVNQLENNTAKVNSEKKIILPNLLNNTVDNNGDGVTNNFANKVLSGSKDSIQKNTAVLKDMLKKTVIEEKKSVSKQVDSLYIVW